METTPPQERSMFEEKVTRFLAAGARQFGLEVGLLARIDDHTYRVVAAHTPDDSIKPGEEFPLDETYCERTIVTPTPVGFHHAKETSWKNHPAYARFQLEAYLGARIMVQNELWGTVNFSSLLPRPRKITDIEKAIVQRLADWIADTIWNRQRELDLRRALEITE